MLDFDLCSESGYKTCCITQSMALTDDKVYVLKILIATKINSLNVSYYLNCAVLLLIANTLNAVTQSLQNAFQVLCCRSMYEFIKVITNNNDIFKDL